MLPCSPACPFVAVFTVCVCACVCMWYVHVCIMCVREEENNVCTYVRVLRVWVEGVSKAGGGGGG